MTEAAPATLDTMEWHHALADLYNHSHPEALLAMLGYITGDLSPELRAETIALGTRYARMQQPERPPRPLTIAPGPLDG